jgi:hypothetical protein
VGDSEAVMTKRVFINYSDRDADFKTHFIEREVFRNIIGDDVELSDYFADNLGYITSFLELEISNSAVFIAFISSDYLQSKYSRGDFWSGIGENVKRRLVFVPVLMGDGAYNWWALA